ncbi:hypothetical protein M9H77_12254 [Catharanthus roseus]|uniref:Uncharacterized protein n=1 Tax=Catharanthus roseus TaxID=4058 RepID=A0ACC0BGX7_CATRO|nr:hypothetical protein M9H77_12254 [Catharanthus roseus]
MPPMIISTFPCRDHHFVSLPKKETGGYLSRRIWKMQAGSNIKFQLNELDELRNEAYENARIDKAKTKAFHDKMISRKSFEPNQKVWLFNSKLRLFLGKLRSYWDGPFIVKQVFPSGAVQIEDLKNNRILIVNGQQLKPAITNDIREVDF